MFKNGSFYNDKVREYVPWLPLRSEPGCTSRFPSLCHSEAEVSLTCLSHAHCCMLHLRKNPWANFHLCDLCSMEVRRSTSLRRLEPCCQGLQHTKGGTQARAGLQPLQHSKAAAVIGPSLWLLSLFGANSCKVCQSIRKYLFPPHLIPTPTNLPIYKGQSTTTLPEKPK